MTTFAELGLSGPLLETLENVGYTTPTPIQEQAIPDLLRGLDVIGQAQTGTGKTAAFGLPMLQLLDPEIHDVQALILTPTRELCIQVAQALRAYGEVRGIDVLATFGGAPIRQQMDRLKTGPQVVVGTVGRVLDLHSRHSLMFHDARFVVLDEADEMLDLGFLEDVETILRKCPSGRQTALFSATMPPEIARLAERHLHDPVTIRVKAPTLTIDTVEHYKLESTRGDKVDALVELLSAERPQQAIVFVRTKIGCDRLARDLDRRKPGLRIRALHGDMSQGARDGVMIGFKDGRVPVLVATDIAARGLDVEKVTHVINYDLPNSAEIYTHRIGRTGRAGRGGRAITLVEPRDRDDLAGIERHINVELKSWTTIEVGRGQKPGEMIAVEGAAGDTEPDAPAAARTPRRRTRATETSDSSNAVDETDAVEVVDAADTTDAVGVADSVGAMEVADIVDPVGAVDDSADEADQSDLAEQIPASAGPDSVTADDTQTTPFAVKKEPRMSEFKWGQAAGDEAGEDDDEIAMPSDATAAEAGGEVADDISPMPESQIRLPRHIKPTQQVLDEKFSLVIVGIGSRAGVEPAEVIALMTKGAGLRGDDVRQVRVLERFTLAHVPTTEAERVAGKLTGELLRGTAIAAEAVVDRQRAPSEPVFAD